MDTDIVLSVTVTGFNVPMVIETTSELPIGIPVQVQFEIVPEAPIGSVINSSDFLVAHMYTAAINSVKARIKPGAEDEEKQIQKQVQVQIDDIMDEIEARRILKNRKKKKTEPNRFTGLEI